MRLTRAAITLTFLVDGLVIGSWAARIPAIKQQAGLSSPQLGVALFAISLGALVAMPLAGWLSDRIGSRLVSVAALLGSASGLFLSSLAGGLGSLAAALLLFGAGFGSINVAANAQGIALERLYGRPILSSFHAAFSLGGLLGAGLGAVAAAAGIAPRGHFAAIALVVAASAVAAGTRLLERRGTEPRHARIVLRLPRTLLLLGAAAFFTMMGEGAAADWSALYLKHSLATTGAVAALAYTFFALAMAASRAVGDRLNTSAGPVALVRGGGLLAAGGLAFALAVGSPVTAIAGFAAMGAGLGVVVPVLFRAAGSSTVVSASAGVAAVSTIGYLGFLAGPPLIGLVAGAVGLRSALVIVVLAALMVALLAGSAGARRAPGGEAPASGAGREPEAPALRPRRALSQRP
jgi:MFS family permease